VELNLDGSNSNRPAQRRDIDGSLRPTAFGV
jgi:hypothetical protein